MKKEIGGYFSLEKPESNGKEFYPDLLALNSGRNAFLFYFQQMNFKKVFLPYYLCDSIYKICIKNHIKYEQYHIGRDFKPIFEKRLKNDELLYIVNYFGQLDSDYIKKLHKDFPNLIVDNVQCFYTLPIDNIPTIYSCRKFFGVPDGGYLSCVLNHDSLSIDNSSDRFNHLIGRLKDGASAHYKEFLENEELFSELPIRLMSDDSKSILKSVNNEEIIKTREENFNFLDSCLSKFNKIQVNKNTGPYCYPLFIENGSSLRDILIQNNIYIPLLWPNVLKEGNSLEKNMAQNILPLPCDQRYNLNDMRKICRIIKKYAKK